MKPYQGKEFRLELHRKGFSSEQLVESKVHHGQMMAIRQLVSGLKSPAPCVSILVSC